jgi:hypothetical protein
MTEPDPALHVSEPEEIAWNPQVEARVKHGDDDVRLRWHAHHD